MVVPSVEPYLVICTSNHKERGRFMECKMASGKRAACDVECVERYNYRTILDKHGLYCRYRGRMAHRRKQKRQNKTYQRTTKFVMDQVMY